MKIFEKYAREAAQFVMACHRLADLQYVTSHGGNLAWRLAADLALITPTQVYKADIDLADLVFIDLKGNVVEGERRPTGETPMYLTFLNQRADIVSVVHCHPPAACAMAISAGTNWLMRPLYPETTTEIGPVPLVPYGEPLTQQLADNFEPYLQKYNSFIMQNHGLVSMSRGDIAWTLGLIELLEMTAQSVVMAVQLGEVHEMDREAVHGLSNVMTTRNLPLPGAPGANHSLEELYFA